MYTYLSASTWPMSPSDSHPPGALRAVAPMYWYGEGAPGPRRIQISGQPDRLGQTPDTKHHGRHQQQPGHPVLVDQAQRLARVEPGHDHDVITEQHRARGNHERRVVGDRPGYQDAPITTHVHQGTQPAYILQQGW
jgi:hypothetical protein